MIFKEMKDTDLVRVLELEQACFKQPWLEKDCLYEWYYKGRPYSL